MNQSKRKIFILLFFAILCYPLYGWGISKNIQLSGVVVETEKPQLSFLDIWNGTYQTQENTYYEQNFPGRNFLIKLRSQLMYSLCKESPNQNVVIGKENQLYEPGYIMWEEAAEGYVMTDAEQAELKAKLLAVRDLLAQHGKEFYIFVTPSKAYYEKDNIPFRYKLLNTGLDNNLDHFKELLESTDLSYFISRDYIDAQLQSSDCPEDLREVPVYYPTGIHWARPWGNYCTAAFYSMMQEQSRFDLGDIAVDVYPYDSAEVEWPDADLYQSLNLFTPPDGPYYSARIRVTREGEKPNVFCRGCSFLGQSWYDLERAGCFGYSLHYENNSYKVFEGQNVVSDTTVSSVQSYDESTDWIPYLQQADIFVLEVNEGGINNVGMGILDYILEHPSVLG